LMELVADDNALYVKSTESKDSPEYL
jgi:hypothetical protein